MINKKLVLIYRLTCFLWLNNALKKYLYNIYKVGLKFTYHNIRYHSKNFTKAVILGSFVWGDTKEGHEYWSGISDKWSNYCITYKY